jgi:hypothetical protein
MPRQTVIYDSLMLRSSTTFERLAVLRSFVYRCAENGHRVVSMQHEVVTEGEFVARQTHYLNVFAVVEPLDTEEDISL